MAVNVKCVLFLVNEPYKTYLCINSIFLVDETVFGVVDCPGPLIFEISDSFCINLAAVSANVGFELFVILDVEKSIDICVSFKFSLG